MNAIDTHQPYFVPEGQWRRRIPRRRVDISPAQADHRQTGFPTRTICDTEIRSFAFKVVIELKRFGCLAYTVS